MEVLGKVHHLGEEIQVSTSYTKRELVIKTDEQYPQFISIEFGQGKCNEYLDKLKVMDEVKVSINLKGREWVNPQGETKYFNSIQGWRIENVGNNNGSSLPQQSAQPTYPPMPTTSPTVADNVEGTDDLPF